MKVQLGSNYEESYAEDGKKRLASVKNYIMKANMVKREKALHQRRDLKNSWFKKLKLQ